MMVLHHPYIVSLYEVMVLPHHYYMILEHVDGGQMLDYIISHGKLKEKHARKFARQIASALGKNLAKSNSKFFDFSVLTNEYATFVILAESPLTMSFFLACYRLLPQKLDCTPRLED